MKPRAERRRPGVFAALGACGALDGRPLHPYLRVAVDRRIEVSDLSGAHRSTVWTQTEVKLDGHGRPIESISPSGGGSVTPASSPG